MDSKQSQTVNAPIVCTFVRHSQVKVYLGHILIPSCNRTHGKILTSYGVGLNKCLDEDKRDNKLCKTKTNKTNAIMPYFCKTKLFVPVNQEVYKSTNNV